MSQLPSEFSSADSARLFALIQECTNAYIDWATAQICTKLPEGTHREIAIGLMIMRSGALVATCLASVIWSAEQADKLDKANNN